MSLSYCTSCRSVEGSWREPTLGEIKEYDLTEEDGTCVCAECDAVLSNEGIPEHDDYDLER